MIDKTPAVGRILVRESPFRHGFFNWGGVITRVSKTRVYYLCDAQPDINYPGHETYKTNFAAICDTQEEVNSMMAFDRSKRAELSALCAGQIEECLKLFGVKP